VVAGRVAQFPFAAYPVDRTNLSGLHKQVSAIVDTLPESALVFARWEELYPLYFVAHLEKGRRDLAFIEERPFRARALSEESTVQFVAERITKHPIYFTECFRELRDAGYVCTDERLGPVIYQRVRQR
jgi:hypothetical protein